MFFFKQFSIKSRVYTIHKSLTFVFHIILHSIPDPLELWLKLNGINYKVSIYDYSSVSSSGSSDIFTSHFKLEVQEEIAVLSHSAPALLFI